MKTQSACGKEARLRCISPISGFQAMLESIYDLELEGVWNFNEIMLCGIKIFGISRSERNIIVYTYGRLKGIGKFH